MPSKKHKPEEIIGKLRKVSPWSGGRYGHGWFIGDAAGDPVRFAWDDGGQMVYVVPDLTLTVVMTSDPGGAVTTSISRRCTRCSPTGSCRPR